MKVSLEELYRSYPIFSDLMNQKIPIKTNLKFRNLITSLSKPYEDIKTIQDSTLSTYALKGDDGVHYIPENVEEIYLSELKEKLQLEIKIDWDKISVNDLGENALLSIKELETISFLFNDLEQEATV